MEVKFSKKLQDRLNKAGILKAPAKKEPDLDPVELHLNDLGPIKLVKDGQEAKNMFAEGTLEDCIYEFLLYAINYHTVFVEFDKHENPKSRRTAGDLYRIMLQYRPGVRLHEIYTALYSLYLQGKMNCGICGGIRRRVYCSSTVKRPQKVIEHYNGTLGTTNSSLALFSKYDEFNTDISKYLPEEFGKIFENRFINFDFYEVVYEKK